VVLAARRSTFDDLQRADGHLEDGGELGGDEQRARDGRERRGEPPDVHETPISAEGPLL